MANHKAPLPQHPLSRLLSYGDKYRVTIWQAATCSILNKLFDLAPPAIIGAAVDVVVQNRTLSLLVLALLIYSVSF